MGRLSASVAFFLQTLMIVAVIGLSLTLILCTLFEGVLLRLYFADAPGSYTGQDADRAAAIDFLPVVAAAWAIAIFVVWRANRRHQRPA